MPLKFKDLIPGIATIGSSIIGALSGKSAAKQQARNIEKTNRARMMLQEHAFSKNKEMWELQKEYNTPEAQMERFKEAGLNPNLIYGQGTPGNVQSYPTYQAPDVDYRGTPSIGATSTRGALSGFQQGSSHIAEVIHRQKQIEGTVIQNQIKDFVRGSKKYETRWKRALNKAKTQAFGTVRSMDKLRALVKENVTQELSKTEIANEAQRLKNKFQKEVNRLAEKGMTMGDSWKIRVGIKILEALGVDDKWINQTLESKLK